MAPTARALRTTLLLVAVPLGCPAAHADTHCGLDAGTAPNVKMWDLQPVSERKTTRELIVSIAKARQRYRACKENGLTVVLRIADSRTIEAVYFVRD